MQKQLEHHENATIDIMVFKTNIKLKRDVRTIGTMLDHESDILEWNVALDDRDCVLRIESTNLNTHYIIKIVQQAGFRCEELLD